MKSPKSKRFDRFFTGVILIVLQVVIIAFISTFLLYKWWSKSEIANFLPAEFTLAVAEVNLSPLNPNFQSFQQLLSKNQFAPDLLDQQLNLLLPNFAGVKTWSDGRAGIAYLQAGTAQNFVLMARIADQKALSEFLRTSLLNNNNDLLIESQYRDFRKINFQAGQNYTLLIAHDYAFFSPNEPILHLIADTIHKDHQSLATDRNYLTVFNNLPKEHLATVYLHYPKLLPALLSTVENRQINLTALQILKPLINQFSGEGSALLVNDQQLQIQQFSLVSSPAKNQVIFQTPFTARFLPAVKSFDPDLHLIVSGRELSLEINKLQSLFNSAMWQDSGGLENLLQQQLERMIGLNITFNQELLDQLHQEYLLAVDLSTPQPQWFLAIQSDQPEAAKAVLSKILLQNKALFARMKPQSREITLPDGTKGTELFADLNNVQLNTDNRPASLEVQGQKLLFWNTGSDYLIVTNQETWLSKAENQLLQPELNTHFPYFKALGKVNEMVIYRPTAEQIQDLPPLANLRQLVFGRKFIDNGILSLYQLELQKADAQN